MCIRHLLLKDEANQVVGLRYDNGSVGEKSDCMKPVSADSQLRGAEKPHYAVPTIGMMVAKQVRKPRSKTLGAPKMR